VPADRSPTPIPSEADHLLELIENVPCAIWELECDATGRSRRFTYLSKNAETLFGYPYEDLLDLRIWWSMVHPDDREQFRELTEAPFGVEGRKVYRHRIVTAAGRTIPVEAMMILVRDDAGNPSRLRGVTIDISERYRNMQRWELLAKTNDVLGASLDFETTLRQIPHLLVPETSDLCTVYLKQASGEIQNLALACISLELEAMVRESGQRFPARAETRAMIAEVLNSKQSYMLEVTDEFRRAHSISEEHYEFQKKIDLGSAIITPLFVEEELLGVIMLSRLSSRPVFSEEDRFFVEQLARQASVAIYRTKLVSESRTMAEQAVEEAERRRRAQERLELLEAVSQCVSGSLNVQELLRQVARQLAPQFADWITIDLADDPAHLDRIFIYHSNPDLHAKAEAYRLKFGREVSRGLLEVLKTGTPVFIPSAIESERERFGLSDERWARLQELGISSLLMVPLRSRRRTLGVLGLDYGHSLRHYTEEDLQFAQELASRIATGIDNAMLFEEAGNEIARRAELQQRLEEARDAVELASRAKDQFIAALSHELRTPLTPVLTTLDLLTDDKEFPESLRPFLELIRRNVEIETRLIDDLLDMTRIAKGKLRLAESDVDLHAVLADVLEICRKDIDRSGLRVVTRLHAGNPFLRGDRDRLSQVFWNVIHNATKFTPEGGLITIRTSNDEAGRVIVEVQDTGAGIEPADLERIFEPFEQRSELRGGSYGGLGLGLSISGSIVALHGGTIEAKSAGAGQGATFIIRFTALAVKAKTPHTPPSRSIDRRKHGGRILMVDDHLDTNTVLKILLERRGYQVMTASSVANGLELARKEPFDVLVSDIGLPDGDGTDLLRAIRSDGAISRTLRAIAMSGYGTQADIDRSLAAGFEFHLKKPIAFPELERAIALVLEEQ